MLNKVTEAVGAYLPRSFYPTVYSLYTRIHPDRDPISYDKLNGYYKVYNMKTDESIYVHDSKYLYRIQSQGMPTFHKRLLEKYTLDGFAEIEQGDTVVDGGAHVGGFSLSAAEQAAHVYAVEPDPRVQQALSHTVQDRDNISVHEIALTDHSGELEFLLGPDPSENSFINVDTGTEAQRIAVTAKTLEDFLKTVEHDSIDFFKLDAEGAEPEVIRGFGEIKPTTVAIDAGPERNGERTVDAVQELLESNGYETRVQSDVVFGRYLN